MTQALTPPADFQSRCADLGLDLAPTAITQLGQYLHQLLETNRKFNLTAIRDPTDAWHRHILESLTLLPHLADAKHVIDIGSGGGAPGLPLAIARPDIHITLVEATGKKARFLTDTAAALDLPNTTVLADRAETLAQASDHREQHDVALARAVGPMRVLLELTLPFVRVGGRLLALKGETIESELRDAGDALMILGAGDIGFHDALPDSDDPAVIVQVAKDRPTPPEFPRRPGIPKQDPL